jgi:hypothetical protein
MLDTLYVEARSSCDYFFLCVVQKTMSRRSNLYTQTVDQPLGSEPTDTMATQPAAKRARVELEVPSFDKLDLETFSLKDNGPGKNGHRAYPLVANESIRFNLTPSGWLETAFGFDVNGKYDKPSFLGGKAPEGVSSEGLGLRITLGEAEAEFMETMDTKAHEAFAAIAKANWNPLVTETTVFGQCKSAKVHVVLKGPELTKIALVVDNKVVRGEGWDFLKDYMDECNQFRRSEVKATVRVKKLWNFAGKAGLKLEATQLVLRPTQRPTEATAFGDDAELLA